MATTEFTKEMVDLLTKIKKHLRDKYDISIAFADPLLLDKLAELRDIKDPLLQGMIRYLMALAGGDWPTKYEGTRNQEQPQPPKIEPALKGAKKLFGLYRGHSGDLSKTDAESGSEDAATESPEPEKKKPTRYYRGQPIYD
ncbi:MAG: hypothetical protein AB7U63_17065 [Porticoccaceae bacterium]